MNPTPEFIEETKARANAGDRVAQCNLGIFYTFGHGVMQDQAVGAKWFLEAAQQGDARAQYNIGIAFERGEGVAHDMAIAFSWYLRAAEQGHAEAQYNVAISYGQGEVVIENQVEALKWLILSSRHGYRKAEAVRSVVIRQYSQVQVAAAQRRASEWKPTVEPSD